MKKKLSFLLIVLLLSMLCIPAQAEGSSIISGISSIDAYEEMLTFFELGEYDTAREILEKYALAEKQIKNAPLYAGYLDAMACMDTEEFALAARLYEGLMAGDTPFLDSALRYHYCTGRHAQQAGNYELAISSYTQSTSFLDSAQRIRECLEQQSKPERVLSFQNTVSTQTSLQLSWNDTAPEGGAYIIRWAPEFITETQAITVHTQSMTVEGLLPGTTYTITLEAEDQPQCAQTITAETLAADPYQGEGFSIHSARLIGVKNTYLNYYSLEELLDEKQTVLTYFDDNRLPLQDMEPALQQMKYCYIFTYQQKGVSSEPVDILWLLRTEDAGTYACEQLNVDGLQTSGRLYVDLEPLLAQLYHEKSGWPQGAAVLELYFDGTLAARSALLIQHE